MEIKKEIIINKPIEEVWNVLGEQFTDAYKWARGLDHSFGHGEAKFEGADCNNRTCEVTGFGTIQEEIRMYDPKKHILSYEVKQGFPDFIATAINTWTLSKAGSNTKVHMNLHIDTKGFKGAIMGLMMKIQLNKTTSGVIEDLKIYIETGIPSKFKTKELQKLQKKAA